MVANQTECSKLEQRSVIQFLVELTQECMMSTEKRVLVKKCLQMVLLSCDFVEKTIHEVETHWLSSKEKVPGTAVS